MALARAAPRQCRALFIIGVAVAVAVAVAGAIVSIVAGILVAFPCSPDLSVGRRRTAAARTGGEATGDGRPEHGQVAIERALEAVLLGDNDRQGECQGGESLRGEASPPAPLLLSVLATGTAVHALFRACFYSSGTISVACFVRPRGYVQF